MSISMLNKSAVKETMNFYLRTCDSGHLSEKDLLLVILEPIVQNRSVSSLVDDILHHGIAYLGTLTEHELSVLFNLDEDQSFQLMSIFELSRRMNAVVPRLEDVVIRTPQDVLKVLQDLQFLDREHFVSLYLNTKNRLIGRETISIGSLNASIVHPREGAPRSA